MWADMSMAFESIQQGPFNLGYLGRGKLKGCNYDSTSVAAGVAVIVSTIIAIGVAIIVATIIVMIVATIF